MTPTIGTEERELTARRQRQKLDASDGTPPEAMTARQRRRLRRLTATSIEAVITLPDPYASTTPGSRSSQVFDPAKPRRKPR